MDDSEIERLASSITFLREWRYFNYEPRVIRFAPKTGCSSGTEAHNEITLSQFTAAEVPKNCNMEAEQRPGSVVSSQSRKDYILYAGGLVWALDWCPRAEHETETDTKCEFIAVAAHPPDSTYHKLGAPLSGRGMVQIWCLPNYTTSEDVQVPDGCTKQKPKKTAVAKKVDNKPVRPRGRPRKYPVNKTPAADPESHFIEAPGQPPEDAQYTPNTDKDLQIVSDPQNMSAPVHDNMQPQTSVIEKEAITYKRRRRKPRESTMDEVPADLLEGQFIPALAVRLPDTTNVYPMDEILQSNPVPMKEKRKKRKVVTFENTAVDKAADMPDSERSSLQPLALAYPESMTSTGGKLLSSSTSELGKRRKIPTKKVLDNDLDFTIAALKKKSRNKSKFCKDPVVDNSGSFTLNQCEGSSFARVRENGLGKDTMCEGLVVDTSLTNVSSGGCHDKENQILPRAVLCLGHDGKVAWDVKWRPTGGESVNKYRMGYLAVVLGNGSIEVWEVPSPQVVSRIYVSRRGKDTDPRFAKLKPVFRCSKLNQGDRRSMPLTVEWSASPPHDLLLAGCHDGVVAVWKFSTDEQCEDTRPLLCFSAEEGPIRALTWAPFDGEHESSNVIVTAGHRGLKFWDLRDPYRPLWDANPSQRFVYGLDWLPDPRCIFISYDDGNLRFLSLSKSTYDVPVTGEPFSGTQQQGLHSFNCSSSAIWSIHVSRLTGVAAYCCADGAVLYFQLTHKAVEKDPSRNRAPHFLCGSLASEGSAVTLNSELPSLPHLMKKSATEWANAPRSARTIASSLNHERRVGKGAEKSPQHGEEVFALCYGDDAETGEGNEAQKSAKSGNGKTGKGKAKTGSVVGAPPKIVSMYRVRWNMNKGSERWLCYGGAAGIVRCQEIVVPNIDKRLVKT